MRRAILLLPLLLLACDMMPRSSRPEDEDLIASKALEVPGPDVLYTVAVKEAEAQGYRIDHSASSAESRRFETFWSTSLGPHRYEGKRKKILGHVFEDPEHPGTWRVAATTWVEHNADVKDPLDPSRAKWQTIEPDVDAAEAFLYRVEQHFHALPEPKKEPGEEE